MEAADRADGEVFAQTVAANGDAGYWSHIIVHKDRGNPGTVVHEGMHLYQNDAVLNRCGNEFNEGITELLTRKVTDSLHILRDGYEDNLAAMAELARSEEDWEAAARWHRLAGQRTLAAEAERVARAKRSAETEKMRREEPTLF